MASVFDVKISASYISRAWHLIFEVIILFVVFGLFILVHLR